MAWIPGIFAFIVRLALVTQLSVLNLSLVGKTAENKGTE